MRKKDIFIAILAGGKGERLWPKSRVRFPKHNIRLLGKRTIIQNTLERARKIAPGNTFIVANKDSFPSIKNQLKNFERRRIVIEPFGRNTAPAIGLAALLTFKENKDSSLIVMPSDHLIGHNKKFFNILNAAIKEANKCEDIITLGVRPTSSKSAYGYIGIEKRPQRIFSKSSYKVVKFIEKPTPVIAKRLVSSGKFFWNSGIFIFKTSAMLSILKKHMPILYRALMALPDIKDKYRFERELRRLYRRLKSDSLDYAILEKTKNIRVIPSDFAWNDIGSFDAIARLVNKDKDGNAILASHVGIDTKKSFITSAPNQLVGTIGVKDLIIVAAPDAVLVASAKGAKDIRKLVGRIKKKKEFLKFL